MLLSRKSLIAAIVMLPATMTGAIIGMATIDRITAPPTTMVGPTIIGPTTTSLDGVEASIQLNSCCNASLANPS